MAKPKLQGGLFRRLRRYLLLADLFILLALLLLDLTDHSPARFIWNVGAYGELTFGQWGAYILFFYLLPAGNFVALATNKDRAVTTAHTVKLAKEPLE